MSLEGEGNSIGPYGWDAWIWRFDDWKFALIWFSIYDQQPTDQFQTHSISNGFLGSVGQLELIGLCRKGLCRKCPHTAFIQHSTLDNSNLTHLLICVCLSTEAGSSRWIQNQRERAPQRSQVNVATLYQIEYSLHFIIDI